MIQGAEISKDRKYRYSLHRIWDNDKPLILWIMLNPSKADHTKDDPTVRKVIAYSKKWGYGGLYIGNLFAYRSTDPKILKHLSKATAIGPQNDIKILDLSMCVNTVIFAWGRNGNLYNRAEEVKDMFRVAHYLELTNSGEPKHPLFLSNDLVPLKFNPNEVQ